ncbi:MAG: hypothetical protein LBL04_11275 [Bacteroidales bacterium]|jgi:hypothetical protein|nr:hypothetical protein [Bacteroidales bacterium]
MTRIEEFEIMRALSQKTGIPVSELVGDTRDATIADYRHVFWYLLHLRGYRPKQIAGIVNRHQWTVYHGINRVKNMLHTDRSIGRIYEELKTMDIFWKKDGWKPSETIHPEDVREIHYNHKLRKLVIAMKGDNSIIKKGDEAVKYFKWLSCDLQ